MNSPSEEIVIKKKHHYVWAYYLKQWARGKNVWYVSSKGGNIRSDSILGLSQSMHFYKVSALNNDDVEFIERFPTTDSEIVQKFHASQLEFFKKISLLINVPSRFEGTEYEAELKKISEWAASNSLEDTYTAIELKARPIFDELLKGDASCLEQRSNMVAFYNYVAHQLARTKKVKDQTFSRMNKANQDNELWVESAKLFEKNWWLIAYNVGINFGHGLVQSAGTSKYMLINNTTKIDFITSDHPVINVHKCVQDPAPESTIDKLDLYYPISPKIAFMLNDSQNYKGLDKFISEDDVISLNLLMARGSHKNIYGSSEQALKDVRKSYRNL